MTIAALFHRPRRPDLVAGAPVGPWPGVGVRVVIQQCGCPPSAFTAEPHNREIGTIVALDAECAFVDWGGTLPCHARGIRLSTVARG
jgi:hypothetical protein